MHGVPAQKPLLIYHLMPLPLLGIFTVEFILTKTHGHHRLLHVNCVSPQLAMDKIHSTHTLRKIVNIHTLVFHSWFNGRGAERQFITSVLKKN